MSDYKPASDKQLAYLDRLGVNYPNNISLQEAKQLIQSVIGNSMNSQDAPFRKGGDGSKPLTNKNPESSNGARTGCALNNAIALVIAGKVPMDYVEIGKCCMELITIMKTLEKQ